MPTLTARALKCTVLLDPAELEGLALAEGTPRLQLRILVDGRTVTADVAAKKAVIAEHGAAQPKAPKSALAAAA
jgi:hypothetical protein